MQNVDLSSAQSTAVLGGVHQTGMGESVMSNNNVSSSNVSGNNVSGGHVSGGHISGSETPGSEILTFRQAARELGLSIPTLRRWQRQGMLPEAYRGAEHQGVWVLREADLPEVARRNGWVGRTRTGDDSGPRLGNQRQRSTDLPAPLDGRVFDFYRRFLPGIEVPDIED